MTDTIQENLDLAYEILDHGWSTIAEEHYTMMVFNDVLDEFEDTFEGDYDEVEEEMLDFMNMLHDIVIELQEKNKEYLK